MMLKLELCKDGDYKEFKRLFYSAFPKEERLPYTILKRKAKKGAAELFIAKENDSFVGFIYLIPYLDMIYIFFFAIDENVRGGGYGSEILQLVRKRNEGKRIFLAREPIDDDADNAGQRRKRREFYRKNGFQDLPLKIIENDFVYEAMGIGGNISAKEYDALITNWSGKLFRRFFGMRVEEG